MTSIILFYFLIEFMGVTLVNKIRQLSGAHFHNTSSVHCIVCSPPQVKSPTITIYPPHTLLHLPSTLGNHHTAVRVHEFLFFLKFFAQSLHPLPSHPISTSTAVNLLFMSLSLFCLLIHFVH